MGYEPITYCRHCNEPNDVYMSFEQRFCSEECEASMEPRAVTVDGGGVILSFRENADLIDATTVTSHLHGDLDELLSMMADDRRRHVEANQASIEEALRKLYGLVQLMRGTP